MESNKIRCPPDFLQFVTSSPSSGISSEGNPPDRGPPGTAGTTNSSKKTSKTSTSVGGLGLSSSSSSATTPSTAAGGNEFSLSKLSNLIQKSVLPAAAAAQAAAIKLAANTQASASTSLATTSSSGAELDFLGSSNVALQKSNVAQRLGSSRPSPNKTSRGPAATVTSQSSSTMISSFSPVTTQSSQIQPMDTSLWGAKPTVTFHGIPAGSSEGMLMKDTRTGDKGGSAVHWEVQSARRATVFTRTLQIIDQLNRKSNLNKEITVSSWPSSEVEQISSTFGLLKNQPGKRKLVAPVTGDVAKKRKLESSKNVKQRRMKSISKQWPNLLGPLIQKFKSSSISQTSQPSTSATSTQTIQPILRAPNSLLIQYDPIKILNRPCLLATLKSNQSNNVVTPSHSASKFEPQVLKTSPVSSKSIVANEKVLSGSSQSQPKTLTEAIKKIPLKSPSIDTQVQPTNSQTQKEAAEKTENTSMPPPKFPPPWSQKKKIDGRSRMSHGGHQPSTSISGCSYSLTSSHQRINRLPHFIPKLNLTKPSATTTKAFEVSYEAAMPVISEDRLRLVTAAIARKVAKRNTIGRLIRERKLGKDMRRPTSSVKPAKTKPVESELSDKTIPKNNLNPSKSSSLQKKELPVISPSLIKASDSVCKKREIFWKKNADIITHIQENPLVDHAIELLRDKRELQKRLELIDEEGIIYRLKPVPKLKTPIPKGQLLERNIPLTATQTKTILQKRLTILLAHQGFTHSNLQPLEVLADVTENFFKKMAHRLKQVTEMEMSGCEQEFPDPMERVMVEMGLGGVRGAEEFYKTRIVDYRKSLEEQCTAIRDEYSKKVRLKVGRVYSAPGGCNSTSSSTSTSGQPLSPGNSVLAEILSGLEEPTVSLPLCNENRPSVQQIRLPTPTVLNPKPQQQQPQTQTTNPKFQLPSSLSSHLQNLSNRSPAVLPIQPPPVQSPAAVTGNSPNLQQPHSSLISISARSGKPKSVTIMQGGGNNSANSPISYSSNMVSINLNNNLDLGGFAGISTAGNSSTTAVNPTVGNIVGSNSNSKAKLKEALSQRNLLRLNFEQSPSNCDSTVLLSSSSPSLSSSNVTSKSSK